MNKLRQILKWIFHRHEWNHGLDEANKNRGFKYCATCKKFKWTTPFKGWSNKKK